MKLKGIIILLIIIVSLLPIYALNLYVKKKWKPQSNMFRLLVYMLGGLLFVFVYTFLLVFLIKKIFPGA